MAEHGGLIAIIGYAVVSLLTGVVVFPEFLKGFRHPNRKSLGSLIAALIGYSLAWPGIAAYGWWKVLRNEVW